MSKSKIEDRLNTMRHKQAQPTDSLTLAEPVKKMKQEQDEIPSLDEISGFESLAEKQAVLAGSPAVIFVHGFVLRGSGARSKAKQDFLENHKREEHISDSFRDKDKAGLVDFK